MKWDDYLNRRLLYKKAWGTMKDEFGGEMREFLDESYLVIAYGPYMADQLDFEKADVGSMALSTPDFFIEDNVSKKLINLAKQHKAARDLKLGLKPVVMMYMADRFKRQLEAFNTEYLNVVDNRAEVRFPVLKMNFIQRLKKSKHCDKESTNMSSASVSIVLSIDKKTQR